MTMKTATRYRQTGLATLAVTVVILLIISLMVFFATRVGTLEQRMAGNEARYKEAFSTAEAGLDFATQRFINRFQTGFTGTASMANIVNNTLITNGTETDGTAAEAGEPSFGVAINNTGASYAGMAIYEFVSTGLGADGTGTSTLRRQITMKKILGGSSPDVPVIVAGSVGTGGDFNIAANPNGGGNGVPVSIWTGKTNANVEMTGSSATCQMEFFNGNNPQCSNPSGNTELISDGDGTTLTAYSSTFPDVLPNDPNFPNDLFQFLFGVPRADWATVKAMAATYNHVIDNCSGLSNTAGQTFRLWWITGNCVMGSNQVIGSQTDPVILIMDDHLLEMKGNGGRIYGVVYIFNNPDDPYADSTSPSTDFNGSSVIYGSLISEASGEDMDGSYSIVYDSMLLTNLTSNNDSANFGIGYIPGSWRDF
ncbi:PilX N-terminal domain-containing pilus assembly protein [Methylomicrobium lacus]|uniref:pilus assembly PilX family protein n=1 Tax=Methylomicrobium lacus TaxID=136992 RepID=UPI0035A859CF